MNAITFFDQLLSKYGHFIPDEPYLKLKYRLREGYWMDFNNPHTLNEKLQWLKLHNRQDKYTQYSDKYEVKKYIKEVLGDDFVIPTIGIWDHPDEIDFSTLPDKFVLKPTHNSSVGRCICTDRNQLDINRAKALLKKEVARGHAIGNHTYSHVQLNMLSSSQACSQVKAANDVIKEITGQEVIYLRPPYGEWDHKKDCPQNMIAVYWDVDPLDWKRTDTKQIAADILRQVKPGDIILLHDIYKTSVQAAFIVIDELQRQGYEFVTVEELLFA